MPLYSFHSLVSICIRHIDHKYTLHLNGASPLFAEEVLLENVELILEAFDYLELPFALKQGDQFQP